MKDLVLEQVRHLAGNLTVLQGRVRDAVSGEVAKAVAESVSDVVGALLSGRLARFPGRFGPRASPGASAYRKAGWDEPDDDSWEHADSTDQAHSSAEAVTNVPAALAMALTAGRWWLVRGRSPWSAAGVGLAVGGALLAGGPVAHTLLGIIWAVHRLLAVSEALGEGARAFDRV